MANKSSRFCRYVHPATAALTLSGAPDGDQRSRSTCAEASATKLNDAYQTLLNGHKHRQSQQLPVPKMPIGYCHQQGSDIYSPTSFHRSQAIEEMVREAGCEVWYLPPYSPDLNQIEHWWFVLKNWMRQRWEEFDSFRDWVMVQTCGFGSKIVLQSGKVFN
jgi:hypothetical protein